MNFIALSGLPRSGSTLLSSILDQNPDIHAEGNSAVCQLMWDLHVSCETRSSEQLRANNRIETQHDVVSSIYKTYYKNVSAKNIVDKCRSWTLPENIKMIKKYITDTPKFIVLTRPIEEIVKSFISLRKKNGWKGDLESDLLIPGSEPIMRSLYGVEYAKSLNSKDFLFIEYNDLVSDTKEVIRSIYSFCEIDFFSHNLNNIVNNHPEDDSVYGLLGMHEVRSKISFRNFL